MKNIIKIISASLLILTTLNGNAGNLLAIKKHKFTSCEDIFYHGSYKGSGEYTIYDENKDAYTVKCDLKEIVFKQENFSSISDEALDRISLTPFDKIKIYHSEDLYFIFNKPERDDKGFLLNTSEAIESVNTNNVKVGDYIVIRSDNRISGVITSNSLTAWCSPINGRYNGSCFNSSKGIGDWEIILL